MREKFLVPDIGEFENVEVIEILVKDGDFIKNNDPLITIESDKSSVEIPSTVIGKVEQIKLKVGDKVSKGDLILDYSTSSEGSLPKDTESIIKQAEEAFVANKDITKNIQQTVPEKKNLKLMLLMEQTLILWKQMIGWNLYLQLFLKMEMKELIF